MSSAWIESHLKEKLVDFLNVEIVLKTITDADTSAMQWLKTTFFYACNKHSLTDAELKGIDI